MQLQLCINSLTSPVKIKGKPHTSCAANLPSTSNTLLDKFMLILPLSNYIIRLVYIMGTLFLGIKLVSFSGGQEFP